MVIYKSFSNFGIQMFCLLLSSKSLKLQFFINNDNKLKFTMVKKKKTIFFC